MLQNQCKVTKPFLGSSFDLDNVAAVHQCNAMQKSNAKETVAAAICGAEMYYMTMRLQGRNVLYDNALARQKCII